jgi:hypothetical protein
MKRIFILAVILAMGVNYSIAQFRSQPELSTTVSQSLIRPDGGGLLFGWFNPSRLTMHNSYTLSYTTSGSRGFSLGTLTSSFGYKISDPLSLRFDLSLMHSPYSTGMGDNFSKNISGVYLTNAELNYKPSNDILLKVQFRQFPGLYWLDNYSGLDYLPSLNRSEEENN